MMKMESGLVWNTTDAAYYGLPGGTSNQSNNTYPNEANHNNKSSDFAGHISPEDYLVLDYNCSNSTNCNEGAIMDYNFEPTALPLTHQVVLYIMYSVAIVLAIAGNFLVIVVLSTGGRSSQKLNALLINLAVSDCLMAVVCIPFTFTNTMLGRWVFGRIMCPLVNFSQMVSVAAGIFTNVAIAFER